MTFTSLSSAIASTMSDERPEQPAENTAVAQAVAPDQSPWKGMPPLALQQLWFSLQRLNWNSVVVLPASPDVSAEDFGRPLYDVARLTLGPRVRLLDGRGVSLPQTAQLILEMAEPGDRARTLVLLDSVITHPPGVPIALGSDGALLCVEMGKTRLASVAETLRLVGREKILGCITLPRARRK
jgi:hypothetical protein